MRPLALASITVALLLSGCSSGTRFSDPTDSAEPADSVATDTAPPDSVPVETLPTPTIAGRYTEMVFADVTIAKDLVYATAPDLVSGAEVELHVDVYQPVGDTLTSRPALVLVHGGGFKAGRKEAVADVATEWARRGYVTMAVQYRLLPDNQCQAIQDLKVAEGDVESERERCEAAIDAAQHDTQASIRWLRANADEYGIDSERIAIGGFSAGAVTAVNVATQSDDPGEVGDHFDQPSHVSAALVASGCSFDPAAITADDAPMYLLASENDQAVPFICTRATERLARAAGIVVETSYYMGEGTHAKGLYQKYQAETDAAWENFLVTHLDLS